MSFHRWKFQSLGKFPTTLTLEKADLFSGGSRFPRRGGGANKNLLLSSATTPPGKHPRVDTQPPGKTPPPLGRHPLPFERFHPFNNENGNGCNLGVAFCPSNRNGCNLGLLFVHQMETVAMWGCFLSIKWKQLQMWGCFLSIKWNSIRLDTQEMEKKRLQRGVVFCLSNGIR